MTVLAFQKPDKVIMIDSDEYYGKFEFRPLEPGYGITVGNSLRRILLSSLEGYAITTVKVVSLKMSPKSSSILNKSGSRTRLMMLMMRRSW
jgi:DNA-directed RNA polymerase alpha subunit